MFMLRSEDEEVSSRWRRGTLQAVETVHTKAEFMVQPRNQKNVRDIAEI